RVERQVCPPDLEAKIAADLNTVRISVFSAFAFGTSPPTVATKPVETVSNPSSFTKYVDGVANNNRNLVNNPANTSRANPPAVLNPAVAQNQPPTQNPPPAQNPPVANPAQPLELTRAVATGQKLRLEFLYAIQPDCSSVGPTTVRILEK